jgi:hypothetical protein
MMHSKYSKEISRYMSKMAKLSHKKSPRPRSHFVKMQKIKEENRVAKLKEENRG